MDDGAMGEMGRGFRRWRIEVGERIEDRGYVVAYSRSLASTSGLGLG